MTTINNNTPKMPSIKERILAVCYRLEIPTNEPYEKHMMSAFHSLLLLDEKFPNAYSRLAYSINKGIRHCDYFDILYRILIQDRCIDDAINCIIDEYKEAANYESSEFYDFMYAVNLERHYFELESKNIQ
jgi:hypothetical protein